MEGAPKIPFGNPTTFKQYVDESNSTGIDALSLIRKKISRPPYSFNNSAKDIEIIASMPLSGAVLRKEEQQIVMDYLSSLVK